MVQKDLRLMVHKVEMMNSTRSQTLRRIEQARKTSETELKRLRRVAAWQKDVRTLQEDRLKLELAAAQKSLTKTKRLASRLESTVRARQKMVKTLEEKAIRQEKQLRTNDARSFVFLVVECWFFYWFVFIVFLVLAYRCYSFVSGKYDSPIARGVG